MANAAKWQPKFTLGISQFIISKTFQLAVIALLFSGSGALACKPGVAELRGDWGQAQFRVQLADTPQKRNLGLMHRESMPAMSGMLFVYQAPQRVSFWMRNTLIPLDMLFIDPDGRVAAIHSNAVPLDETPIAGGDGRLAVLEINGGMAETLGIDVGSVIRHPSLPQETAIWSCEVE